MHKRLITSHNQRKLNQAQNIKSQNNRAPITYTIHLKSPPTLSVEELQKLHEKGIKCLQDSDSPYGSPDFPFQSDMKEREEHFEYLKKVTEKYRNVPSHCFEGYCGQWIEEVWINTFINESLKSFGPYIPLFIPWLNQFKVAQNPNIYQNFVREVVKLLKPNYIYITVVQSCFGIEGAETLFNEIPENILIISPTGRGHVPIPHLKEVQNVTQMLPELYTASFIGKSIYTTRKKMLQYFLPKYGKKIFYSPREENWSVINQRSRVILSPRGFGIGCWRTYEVLQSGFIPVIIYDDVPWIPYPNLPWNEMSIINGIDHLDDIYSAIESIDEKKRQKMRKVILEHRHYLTYEGVMEQIALFMFGKGELRCTKYNPRINDGLRNKQIPVPKNQIRPT